MRFFQFTLSLSGAAAIIFTALFSQQTFAQVEQDVTSGDGFGLTTDGDYLNIYAINKESGEVTDLITTPFDSNVQEVGSGPGTIWLKSGSDKHYLYDWENDIWKTIIDEGVGPSLSGVLLPSSYFSSGGGSSSAATQVGNSVRIGAKGGVTINPNGVSVAGDNLIRQESDGSVHIGKNSLITKEEDGKQKMWATNAQGDSIDIEITNGSDLLINGKSVQGQINSNAKNINENAKNINNLGAGVAASTALTSALSALPTAATDAPFSCGVGTGGYSSRFAMSLGCAAKLNQRLSFNVGGSHVFGGSANYGGGSFDTVAARAGFVFKLGKIETSAASNRQLQSKVDSLEKINISILEQNKTLLLRLERLEAIALGQQPATTTASLK